MPPGLKPSLVENLLVRDAKEVLGLDAADPVVVGIDGGYVRNWYAKKRRFEVVVGKSIVKDRNDRYFGLVQTHDDQPKRRIASVLREQGLSMTEEMTFLTDGRRQCQKPRRRYVALCKTSPGLVPPEYGACTISASTLDGLKHHDPKEAAELADRIDRIKWCLWHGKTDEALRRIRVLADDLTKIETRLCPHETLRSKDRRASYLRHQQSKLDPGL